MHAAADSCHSPQAICQRRPIEYPLRWEPRGGACVLTCLNGSVGGGALRAEAARRTRNAVRHAESHPGAPVRPGATYSGPCRSCPLCSAAAPGRGAARRTRARATVSHRRGAISPPYTAVRPPPTLPELIKWEPVGGLGGGVRASRRTSPAPHAVLRPGSCVRHCGGRGRRTPRRR